MKIKSGMTGPNGNELPRVMRPSGKGVTMDGALPPPEGVDLTGVKQVDSHRMAVVREARKAKVATHRGGRHYEQETVKREGKKAPLAYAVRLVRAAGAGV